MVFFLNRRKEREQREQRALEAILQSFEDDLEKEKKPRKEGEKPAQDASPPGPPSEEKDPTAVELAAFLERKGIIRHEEWREFLAEARKEAPGKSEDGS
jgi:hypothetical protein